jgi:hypothetical protein
MCSVREVTKRRALVSLALIGVFASSAAIAGPAVCLDTITGVELVHRVKQDAYFTHNTPAGKRLQIESDGCGYRIHVAADSNPRKRDLLLVDQQGRVTKVIHQH